jgi:molybdopterin-containing oxidoreductase family membrane subunit
MPLILLSILTRRSPSVTAFVYNGLAARPFWNIDSRRVLASAFCSQTCADDNHFQILKS